MASVFFELFSYLLQLCLGQGVAHFLGWRDGGKVNVIFRWMSRCYNVCPRDVHFLNRGYGSIRSVNLSRSRRQLDGESALEDSPCSSRLR